MSPAKPFCPLKCLLSTVGLELGTPTCKPVYDALLSGHSALYEMYARNAYALYEMYARNAYDVLTKRAQS